MWRSERRGGKYSRGDDDNDNDNDGDNDNDDDNDDDDYDDDDDDDDDKDDFTVRHDVGGGPVSRADLLVTRSQAGRHILQEM